MRYSPVPRLASLAWLGVVLSCASSCSRKHSSPETESDSERATKLIDALVYSPSDQRPAIFREINLLKIPQVLPSLIALGFFEELRDEALIKHYGFSSNALSLIPETKTPRELYDYLFRVAPGFAHTRDRRFKQRTCGVLGDEYLDSAMLLLEHEDPILRYFAVACLYNRRISAAFTKIYALVQNAPESACPWLAALRKEIMSSFSLDRVCDGIAKGDAWSIAHAIHRKDQRSTEAIITLINNPSAPNTLDSMWALGEIGSRSAIPALIKHFQLADYFASADAAEALGKIGDPVVLPILIDQLPTAESWPQAHIIGAIGLLGSLEDVQVLEPFTMKSVKSGAVDIQRSAQRAIERIKARDRVKRQ